MIGGEGVWDCVGVGVGVGIGVGVGSDAGLGVGVEVDVGLGEGVGVIGAVKTYALPYPLFDAPPAGAFLAPIAREPSFIATE